MIRTQRSPELLTLGAPEVGSTATQMLAEIDLNADSWWHSTAMAGIRHLADTGLPFTAPDLTELGVPDPDHPARWGALFAAAAAGGIITSIGFATSRRPTPSQGCPAGLDRLGEGRLVTHEPSAWLRSAVAARVEDLRAAGVLLPRLATIAPLGRSTVVGTVEDRSCDRCGCYVEPGDTFMMYVLHPVAELYVVGALCENCHRREVGS